MKIIDSNEKIIETLEHLIDQLQDLNAELYTRTINRMDDEQLRQEFCDKVGDAWEVETLTYKKDFDFIRSCLIDTYQAAQK